MSDPVGGTRGQTPEDVQHLSSRTRPAFAPGDAVPGLSSWLLDRKLGGGGFGEVWLAKHAWIAKERPRAVKFCTDPEARHRLVTHEKNVVLRVMKYAGDHPHIVPLLDCNLDGNAPWLMYEFVEGATLVGLIEQWRELPLPKRLGRAVRTLQAIASALARCHRLDPPLVHRDLKPQNVLMAEGKVPRIIDFGIGGVAMQPKSDGTTGALTAFAARIPTALHNAGTRLYAPPEQLFGAPPNPRDDVYALGIIAFQMIVGDLLTGPGPDAALELRDLKVPGELASLIVKSVAMNADRRPKDATEWEVTLGKLLQKSQKEPETTDGASGLKVVAPPAPTERPARTAAEPPPPAPPQFDVELIAPPPRPAPPLPPPPVPPRQPSPANAPAAGRPEARPEMSPEDDRFFGEGLEDEAPSDWRKPAAVLGALALGGIVLLVVLVSALLKSNKNTTDAKESKEKDAQYVEPKPERKPADLSKKGKGKEKESDAPEAKSDPRLAALATRAGENVIDFATELIPLRPASEPKKPARVVLFKEVQPIFRAYCNDCHGGSTGKPKGNVDLTSLLKMLKSQGPPLIAGKPMDSTLYTLVKGGDMPPDGKKGPNAQELQLIYDWIASGAKERRRTIRRRGLLSLV
jgi:eukaryotic-like serine/threonine-protein kinase